MPVATTGIVLQEVLQGARTDRELNLLRGRLGRLPFLRADKETHVEAARFHRKARARGWSVPATDALIAATAVAHVVALLTADTRHFRALARVSKRPARAHRPHRAFSYPCSRVLPPETGSPSPPARPPPLR